MLDKRLEKISVHFLIFLLLLGAVKVQVHNVEIRTFGTVVPSWWPTILLPPVIYTNSERLNLIFFFSLSSSSVNVYINSAMR